MRHIRTDIWWDRRVVLHRWFKFNMVISKKSLIWFSFRDQRKQNTHTVTRYHRVPFLPINLARRNVKGSAIYEAGGKQHAHPNDLINMKRSDAKLWRHGHCYVISDAICTQMIIPLPMSANCRPDWLWQQAHSLVWYDSASARRSSRSPTFRMQVIDSSSMVRYPHAVDCLVTRCHYRNS